MKSAIITGASSSTGLAIVKSLCEGYKIVAQYNTTLPNFVHCNVTWVQKKLSSSLDVKEFIDANTNDTLDLLVNAIGPLKVINAKNLTIEDFDSQIFLNLSVVHYLCSFAREKIEKCSGDIINFSYAGVEQVKASVEMLPYTIAKTGIIILSKTLATVMAGSDARCNVISPGYIYSPDVTQETIKKAVESVPMKRMATVGEVAESVKMILNAPRYITGANINIGGGLEF